MLGLCRKGPNGLEHLVEVYDKHFPIHSGSLCGDNHCPHKVPPSTELPREFLAWIVDKFANADDPEVDFWVKWANYFSMWLIEWPNDPDWKFWKIPFYRVNPPVYQESELNSLTCTEPYLCYLIENVVIIDSFHCFVSLKDACGTCAPLVKRLYPGFYFLSHFSHFGSPMTKERKDKNYKTRWWIRWKYEEK